MTKEQRLKLLKLIFRRNKSTCPIVRDSLTKQIEKLSKD